MRERGGNYGTIWEKVAVLTLAGAIAAMSVTGCGSIKKMQQ